MRHPADHFFAFALAFFTFHLSQVVQRHQTAISLSPSLPFGRRCPVSLYYYFPSLPATAVSRRVSRTALQRRPQRYGRAAAGRRCQRPEGQAGTREGPDPTANVMSEDQTAQFVRNAPNGSSETPQSAPKGIPKSRESQAKRQKSR